MIELAVIEAEIFRIMKGIGDPYGFLEPTTLPLASGDNTFPRLIFFHMIDRDIAGIGPGRRIMNSALYGIGVLHEGKTYGVTLPTPTPVPLLSILGEIDAYFQDYWSPSDNAYGRLFSCERESNMRLTEEGEDKVLRRKDGGFFRFHAQKA